MTLVVTPKTKNEEKVLKAFLQSLNIGFHTEAEEDAALIKAMQQGRKTSLLNESEKKAFLNKLKNAK